MRPRRLWVLVAALLAASCCGAQVRDGSVIARRVASRVVGRFAAPSFVCLGLLRYPQQMYGSSGTHTRTAQPSTS